MGAQPAAERLGTWIEGGRLETAVYSSVADGVELCLFDSAAGERRIELRPGGDSIWRGSVPNGVAGQQYGFRVHGPWNPREGVRCNPAKLLLDPYARLIAGQVQWDDAVLGHQAGAPDMASTTDSAAFVPRSVVVDPSFDWRDDVRPNHPLVDSIVYELHVKGFTKLNCLIPEALRGTYAGLAHPAALEYLTHLGVTAVELLPVHQFVHDGTLLDRGLRNYWGYQSIGFFAPHNEYAVDPAAAVDEFKRMVATLHDASLEVILDVVYNHTAEGDQRGPTLAFRGLDNAAYYKLPPDRFYYWDETGCGNTVDAGQPAAMRLIIDSLRYWAEEMHVDGFRFDLAAALGREEGSFETHAAFLEAVTNDPALRHVKLIAEPWDAGQVDVLGEFPRGWCEWNDRYRDQVRGFWRGDEGSLGNMATRLLGSSDIFQPPGRRPTASVNFVASHDGLTLADIIAYDWRVGGEGPTTVSAVTRQRDIAACNLLASVLLSAGVPMISHGDEIGRTQHGNDNAYDQDNPTSWIDWTSLQEHSALRSFVAACCHLRRSHPAFREASFVNSDALTWLNPDGRAMAAEDWQVPWARAVAALRQRAHEPAVLLALSAAENPVSFQLPRSIGTWSVLVTSDPAASVTAASLALPGPSIAVLECDQRP